MIFQAIDAIRVELIAGGVPAELGNIGEILAGSTHGADENIVISLINIEENRISRDPQNFIRNGLEIKSKNPAVHLYLTLLFTSVRHEGGYGKALESIQNTISFFQKKYVFDHSNSALDSGIERLILEMLSMNLEQLHQLWSMLGGKYHPSVAYRMKMVTLDSVTNIDKHPIQEIETTYYLK
jgi:hypothetical protein